MTTPGGGSGENAHDDANRPHSAEQTPPDRGASGEPAYSGYEPPPSGFEPPSPPSGYPPPAYPPPGYPQAGYPPPGGHPSAGGPPPGYQDASGYGGPSYPPVPPQYGSSAGGYGQPYPGGYPGPEYPGGYGAPPQSGTNNLAIASLVTSVIGLIPYCGGLLSIAGIVLGTIAVKQIKQTGQQGYGLAVAGIVVGTTTLLVGLILLSLLCHDFGSNKT
ncbi:DUF4190 domain-containing protein [Mycobacterium noviomagense]|uniref:DUF4190 domain-containing protein n=1 Tax=Mycobacterium noviomagense TaxID=459858 RepID=A0A7I7P9A2_9MYCO|nr:DUF4190 domain-containing protein [Mycobacterium noviomagense]ORB18227.1 hypothetical protein BST37_02070 [Mycobacterium noviomagense]BBY05158.1 hypothetical protein MNVI_04760 [Mycobacterium noviomagense]